MRQIVALLQRLDPPGIVDDRRRGLGLKRPPPGSARNRVRASVTTSARTPSRSQQASPRLLVECTTPPTRQTRTMASM